MNVGHRTLIIIDTENHAAAFCRELGQWLTGLNDGCRHEDTILDLARAQIGASDLAWMEEHVVMVPDEYRDPRVAAMVATPGWFNHGHGACFPDHLWDSEEVRRSLDEALAEYEEENRNPDGSLDDHDTELLRGWREDGPTRCPAYLSVAIEVTQKPERELLERIAARAHRFSECPQVIGDGDFSYVKITAVRLVDERIVHTDLVTIQE